MLWQMLSLLGSHQWVRRHGRWYICAANFKPAGHPGLMTVHHEQSTMQMNTIFIWLRACIDPPPPPPPGRDAVILSACHAFSALY